MKFDLVECVIQMLEKCLIIFFEQMHCYSSDRIYLIIPRASVAFVFFSYCVLSLVVMFVTHV